MPPQPRVPATPLVTALTPPFADRMVPRAVISFARQHGPTIVLRGLRHNLLLHLTTLWDFAVLDSRTILHAMRIVDAYATAMGIAPGPEGYQKLLHIVKEDTTVGKDVTLAGRREGGADA